MRPIYIKRTFQKAHHLTLVEIGLKCRRLFSTTSIHISKSGSAVMGMSIIQKGSQQGRSEIMLKDEKNRAGSSEY